MRIQDSSGSNARGSLRSVFSLSLGTLVVQSLSAGGQFALALWLAPSEFGYWAAAVSAMTTLTALTNFGEVNGYLSGSNNSFQKARLSAFRLNLVLFFLGLGISISYYSVGKLPVALYCLIIALTLPLNGDTDMKIAAGVHYKRFSNVVSAQAFGAITKFASSLFIAYVFQSALALALSTTIYYLVVGILLRGTVAHAKMQEVGVDSRSIPIRQRVSWALNSYFMTFPVQAIFLGAQFVLSPSQLGLLYIGFQITLALSGLLAVPLNRVVLSSLSKIEDGNRGRFVALLSGVISVIVTLVSLTLALVLSLFSDLLPPDWIPAIPVAIAFLVAMPMRILTPIIEARQQVEKKWIQATMFNIFESVGSILAVVIFSSFDSLLVLALVVSGWKIVFGVARTGFVLRGEAVSTMAIPPVVSIVGSLLLLGGVWQPVMVNSVILLCFILGGAIYLVFSMLRRFILGKSEGNVT